MRRGGAVLCLTAVVAILVLGTVTPAGAAPATAGCPAGLAPPAAVAPTARPWPQQRYDLDRLAPVADGYGITVAVIDSGVDATWPQLRDRVLPGADELAGGDGRQDCVGHGTAVASIIAAAPGQGEDALRGVAPGARILPIRVTELTAEGTGAARPGSASGLADAIHTAVDRGARVLNISMVLAADDPRVAGAVRYALAHRVVVVAAVGNGHRGDGGEDPVPYPAGYPGVIGVGAIDADGQRLAQSQVGGYVKLVAPGGAVVAGRRAGWPASRVPASPPRSWPRPPRSSCNAGPSSPPSRSPPGCTRPPTPHRTPPPARPTGTAS